MLVANRLRESPVEPMAEPFGPWPTRRHGDGERPGWSARWPAFILKEELATGHHDPLPGLANGALFMSRRSGS